MSGFRYPRAILATCPIPWDSEFRLDETVFRKAIRRIREHVSQHIYLFGTAGEGYAVTETMFARILEVFLEEMSSPNAVPMIGVIHLSLPATIERIHLARSKGVRQFQISLPAWGALNDRELDTFFDRTCGSFPDCSFLHYNLQRSGRVLTASEYERLASRHPNLVAVKMGGRDIGRLRATTAPSNGLRFFFTEWGFTQLADETKCGLLATASMVFPNLAKKLFTSRMNEREECLAYLDQIRNAVVESVQQSDAHMDGAYDKAYLKLLLKEFPLRLLPPYRSMSSEAFADLENQTRGIKDINGPPPT